MSSQDTKTPTGGVFSRGGVGSTYPNHHLLERILSTGNVKKAWKRVKANRGAPGIDGVTVEEFSDTFRPLWKDICASITAGTYKPAPVKRVDIPKSTGGTRPLGIPTVLDRLIQQAIVQVLTPMFDPGFSESSFGYRPGRSAHHAIRQAVGCIRDGYKFAVDIDLEKFFDTVVHDVLMHRVSRVVRDKRVLRLIGRYLRSGVVENGCFWKTVLGVPQGGPLSPLLANIMLDDLDKELEKRGHRFVRYADDFIVFVKSPRAGIRVAASIRRFVERELKLKINERKSGVRPTNRVRFLGFIFRGTKVRWSFEAFNEFKRRVRELTGRSWGVSMEYRMDKLKEYLRGWMGYYGISEYYRPIPEIDSWLRRRIRACYWKQWKTIRKRRKMLLKQGISRKYAILTAGSHKGPWRLSQALAVRTALTNKWLEKQGLMSVKKLWVKIHYGRAGVQSVS